MWMCEVRLDDETTIHAYKHAMTRRYLHLDAGGRAFHYDESIGYTDIAGPIAIARAFVGWERSWSTDREKAALRDAMCRARRGLDFRYHAP
jgi:hypothetical protein